MSPVVVMSNLHVPAPDLPLGRFHVGEALVDPATREIHMRGARRPTRVTPKAMAVLCALAEAPGEVLTRAALFERVWPDTLPTDDVLTQAVTQLRKAFGADGKACIETIAKRGYRLTVPVAALQEVPAGVTVAQDGPQSFVHDEVDALPESGVVPAPAAPSRWRQARPAWTVAVLSGVLVPALLLLGWWMGRTGPVDSQAQMLASAGQAQDRPYRLITSTLGFEFSPSLSPDATRLAYVSAASVQDQPAIRIQSTQATQSQPLTRPPQGAGDHQPAWSPDGRDIAFARRWADGRCQVMIIPANGEREAREVATCEDGGQTGFSWSVDGRRLLFGASSLERSTAIRALDLSTGQWQRLDYAPRPDALDVAPRQSPDGRWVGFVRNPQVGDLWRVPSEGGQAEQLTELGAEIRGWSWLPDSQAVVFGRRVESGTRLYRLDVDTRQLQDLGIEDAQSPDVAAGAQTLAFVRRKPRFDLHRVSVGDAGQVASEPVFVSSGRDTQPVVSPDGRQMVFNSDRSGHFELWWVDLDRPASLHSVGGVRPDTLQSATWSADSRRVLVPAWTQAQPVIIELEPATGRATELPIPDRHPLQALAPADADHLLVNAEESGGGTRLTLYDRSQTPWRPIAQMEGVSQLRLDPTSGDVLFTRLDRDGLWAAAPSLAPESVRQLDAGQPSRLRALNWTVAGNGQVQTLQSLPRTCAVWLQPVGGGGDGRCLAQDLLASTTTFSITPQGDVYVSLAVDDGTDLAVMQVPQMPDRPIASFFNWLTGKGKMRS